jgi:hypothetical protein
MGEVVDLLRLQDVRMTPALVRDEGGWNESIAFLLRAGLIRSERDPRGEILYYEESRLRALDVYRNVLFHFLVAPSLLARQLQRGATLRPAGIWALAVSVISRVLRARRRLGASSSPGRLLRADRCVERFGDRYQVRRRDEDTSPSGRADPSVIEAYYANFSSRRRGEHREAAAKSTEQFKGCWARSGGPRLESATFRNARTADPERHPGGGGERNASTATPRRLRTSPVCGSGWRPPAGWVESALPWTPRRHRISPSAAASSSRLPRTTPAARS